MILEALRQVVAHQDLTEPDATGVMDELLAGRATPAQVGGLLVALRMKGETAEELAGFARALRRRMRPVALEGREAVDTCGTGGDGARTFNVSTASALVASAAGVLIAKHGNVAVTSRCGSADVLAALGVNIQAGVETVQACLDEVGLAFLFAPLFHDALRQVGPIRRELPTGTIFNLLGPLVNPAGATRQVIGVAEDRWVVAVADAARRLGSAHVLVVHGADGLDEVSISGPTHVAELREGRVTRLELTPEGLGVARSALDGVRGGDAAMNAGIVRAVLQGEPGPARDLVLVNAACAIYVGGRARTIAEGVTLARETIDQGRALQQLERLKACTNRGGPA